MTDILIWVFCGNSKAAMFVDSLDERHVSVITYKKLDLKVFRP